MEYSREIEAQVELLKGSHAASPEKRIANFIRDRGEVTLSMITHRYQRYGKPVRTSVLERLIRDGSITLQTREGAGRPATVITWNGE